MGLCFHKETYKDPIDKAILAKFGLAIKWQSIGCDVGGDSWQEARGTGLMGIHSRTGFMSHCTYRAPRAPALSVFLIRCEV